MKIFWLLMMLPLPLRAAIDPPIAPKQELTPSEKSTIGLFKSANRSVVYITTLVEIQDFFSLNVLEIPHGTGSGFIWDGDGHVVTNFHVVQEVAAGRGSAQVTLFDRSKWPAEVIGVAPDKDLAVLQIKAPQDKLYPILVGRSSDLLVGQSVFAIGDPFGLDQTLTTGVVSALGREIQSLTGRPIQDVIQTDASINPGNSGGPLLDSGGRLIGVNTQIYSPSGASAGIGFAVPVDTIYRIVPQLIKYGHVIRPTIGVTLVPEPIAAQWGLIGAVVLEVIPGTAAQKAGLKPTRRDQMSEDLIIGDQIVGLNKQKIESPNDLYNALEKYRIGEKVVLELLNDDRHRTVTLPLESSR